MKQKIYQFEDFVLDQKNRQIFFRGNLINLTTKNFEILSLLVENSMKIVGKREIFEAVWMNDFVEENNLPVRISSLRNLFRNYGYTREFIKTVSGRGYIFVVSAQEINKIQWENYNSTYIRNSERLSEAANLCFKGNYIIDSLPTRTNLKNDLYRAEEFFNSAARLDPNCAEAYVGSARCKMHLYNYDYLSKAEARSKCASLLQQAQSANPKAADIFYLEGLISLFFELNLPKTQKSFLKAVKLNQNYSHAYYYLGITNILLNNLEKARTDFLKACELMPNNIRFRNAMIRIYYNSEDYNRAIAAAEDILEMEGRSYEALFFLALSYARLGIYDEALRCCDEFSKTIDIYEIRLVRAYVLVLMNQNEEADELIKEILADEKRLGKSLIYIVSIYTAQNKLDEAFDLLFKCYEKSCFDILLIRADPGFKSLRADKRFQIILEKLSLLLDR